MARRCSRSIVRCRSTATIGWCARSLLLQKRVLKRIDLTARTFYAMIEPGSAFAGSLFELALAADRSYMLATSEGAPPTIELSPLNGGTAADEHGLVAAARRGFSGDEARVAALLARETPLGPEQALEAGLVTFAPDDIDWDDEVQARGRGARGDEPRRADGYGSEPALRRARDDGDEDIRAACRHGRTGSSRARTRPARRARSRVYGKAGQRPSSTGGGPERNVGDEQRLARGEDPEQRRPLVRQASAARARAVAAGLSRLVARDGAGRLPVERRLPAHGDLGRRERLGALRHGEDARVSLGHLPRRPRAGSHDRIRRPSGEAGLERGAGRVPQSAAPADRHAGRHGACVGRAAAAARQDVPIALRPAEPLPGERRGRPPPVGDGVPAAHVLRPRRPRGGRGAAAAPLGRTRTSRAFCRPSTSRSRIGSRS